MTNKIRRLLAIGNSVQETALKLNVSKSRVYTVRWLDKKNKQEKREKREKREKQDRSVFTPDNVVNPQVAAIEKKPSHGWIRVCPTLPEGESPTPLPTPDPVNHPPHYKAGGIETIDYIEAKDFNYRLGNVIKYVSRAGKKEGVDPVQDLEKAAWYLQREIDARKRA
jgi:hypothetical protein